MSSKIDFGLPSFDASNWRPLEGAPPLAITEEVVEELPQPLPVPLQARTVRPKANPKSIAEQSLINAKALYTRSILGKTLKEKENLLCCAMLQTRNGLSSNPSPTTQFQLMMYGAKIVLDRFENRDVRPIVSADESMRNYRSIADLKKMIQELRDDLTSDGYETEIAALEQRVNALELDAELLTLVDVEEPEKKGGSTPPSLIEFPGFEDSAEEAIGALVALRSKEWQIEQQSTPSVQPKIRRQFPVKSLGENSLKDSRRLRTWSINPAHSLPKKEGFLRAALYHANRGLELSPSLITRYHLVIHRANVILDIFEHPEIHWNLTADPMLRAYQSADDLQRLIDEVVSCAAPVLDKAPHLDQECKTELKELIGRVDAIGSQVYHEEILGQFPQGDELFSEDTSLKRPRVEDGSDKDIQPPQKRGKV